MNWKDIWMTLFGTVDLFRTRHGLLGVHGGSRADRGRDECRLLGHEARKKATSEAKRTLTQQGKTVSIKVPS